MEPKDGLTTEAEVAIYIAAATEFAQKEADEHYARLFAAFVEAVPACFHRTGEMAPSPVRSKAFNADAKAYTFWLRFGEDYAATAAIFVFKKKALAWRLKYYLSQMMVSPFQCEQVSSKSLAAAILTAREMWLAHQNRGPQLPAIAPQSDLVN